MFELTEQQRTPLTRDSLANIPRDLNRLSSSLWSFLGQHCLADVVYDRRLQLTNGEDCNGIELWRKLFRENEGGAEQVTLSGLKRLHRFPECPSKELLGHYLGEWRYLKTTFGSNIPDASLYTMLLNMLPSGVQKEVRDRRNTLTTTQAATDYLDKELDRYQDK